MAANKKREKEWLGALGEPIVVPLRMPPPGEELALEDRIAGLPAAMKKLALLADHYGMEQGDYLGLLLCVARDLIPGFQTVYDDPMAAKMGLRTKAGTKSGNQGRGALPYWTGERLITFVEALKNSPSTRDMCSSDKSCAKLIVESATGTTIKGKLNKTDKEKLISNIARRIRAVRTERYGPAPKRGRSDDV